MFIRALIAFLLLPGIVAFVIPAAWLGGTGHTELVQPLGLIFLGLGIFGLLWCVRDFYVSGKGTLAPWAPPKNLVIVGLYRYTRNPMYVSVDLVLLGWAAAFGSLTLLLYMLLAAVTFHIRVVRGEEPWLANTHGKAWDSYIRQVPRWLW